MMPISLRSKTHKGSFLFNQTFTLYRNMIIFCYDLLYFTATINNLTTNRMVQLLTWDERFAVDDCAASCLHPNSGGREL